MHAPTKNPPFLSPCNHQIFFFSFFTLILSLFLSSCYSLDVQSQALLAWKASLNSSSDALRSWNSTDSSPCHWFGVHCDSNDQVTEIVLKSVELQGPLPSTLHPLKSLSKLILSSTNLTGPIPKELGECTELSVIDISKNSLVGKIPVEVCRLSKLKTLALNTNFLQGDIPLDIGNLSSLVNLLLFDNQLSGGIPKGIGNLKNLEVFRAGGKGSFHGRLGTVVTCLCWAWQKQVFLEVFLCRLES